MLFAAVNSGAGIYNAILCTTSEERRALGGKEVLRSKMLRWTHPHFRTPWAAVIVNTCCIGPHTLFRFDEWVVVNNLISSTILLMMYAALIRLRLTRPDMPSP